MHLLVTDPGALGPARTVVDAELDAIEIAASRFRSDSEVCALARAGGTRQPVSPMLGLLLEAALGAARATDGDVDPTIGTAIVELGYDHSLAAHGSASPQISSLAVQTDWTAIEFDGQNLRMPAGTLLDLGSTAKAVAADRCAREVHRRTGVGVLINLGGDIATAGPAPDGGWRVLVQDTPEDPASQVTIGTDTGLATSSTRRRRWRRGGADHHHILDPRTGTSAEPVWRSVSVAAQTCLAANTVSTAAIVRGQRAMPWISALGVPARLVDREGDEHTVGGWPS